MKWIDELQKLRVIPVVRLKDADTAVPMAAALRRGGLPCAEITFRTPAAAESLRRIHEADPEFLLAAGTVLTTARPTRPWRPARPSGQSRIQCEGGGSLHRPWLPACAGHLYAE